MKITNVVFKKIFYNIKSYHYIIDIHLDHTVIFKIRLGKMLNQLYHIAYDINLKSLDRYILGINKKEYDDLMRDIVVYVEDYIKMSISEYTLDELILNLD